MRSSLSRRDFIKLGSILALSPVIGATAHFITHKQSVSKASDQPNIVIILLDTLCARHLSLYGYRRETTPNLEKFARKATVYHAHHAAANFTTPSTASLLTGTYPWSHRAFHFSGSITKNLERKNIYNQINDGYLRIGFAHNLLANTLLYQIGQDIDKHIKIGAYSLLDTTVYDNLFPNDPLAAYRSFDQYMVWGDLPGSLYLSRAYTFNNIYHLNAAEENFASIYPRGLPFAGSPPMIFTMKGLFDGAMQILDTQQSPYFAYIHLYPPHEPYRPHKKFVGMFHDNWIPDPKKPHFFSKGFEEEHLNTLRAKYDEYIANTDAELGRLFNHLEKTGVLENSYVMVTTDHGQLFERGIHGHNTPLLYEPLIHIPLIISKPQQNEQVDIHTPTSNIDLLPTIMHITKRPIPEWSEGEVLPGFNVEIPSQRSIYAVEAKTNFAAKPLTTATFAVIKDRYKLIHYRGYDGYDNFSELYDLINDPEELEDLIKTQPAIAGELQAELDAKVEQVNLPYR